MSQSPPKPQATTASKKEAAEEFLRLVVKGEVKQACEKFIAPGFRHHNAGCEGDANGLMKAMEENHAKHPHKVLEIQRSLEDGEHVAIHSRLSLSPGHNGMAVVHLFRFGHGRIEELWDIGQEVPQSSPNRHGMF
jgi:predicted SnoaL-like aldol condensation-catalyzing enzyme